MLLINWPTLYVCMVYNILQILYEYCISNKCLTICCMWKYFAAVNNNILIDIVVIVIIVVDAVSRFWYDIQNFNILSMSQQADQHIPKCDVVKQTFSFLLFAFDATEMKTKKIE